MNDILLNKWINMIPQKKILSIQLDNNLSNKYNKLTKLNYIISFDVEFIRYLINNEQVKTISELGGILLIKNNNIWFIYCTFHLNLKPLVNNINQYYLLTSNYNTLNENTYKKVFKNEKLLLPEFKINENNYNDILKNDPIINIYMKPKQIIKLSKNSFDYINKKINKIKYIIKGYDLIKYPLQYNLFKKNINLILNDSEVKKRLIINDKKFINLTNLLFSQSYLIIKGLEDLKALKYHSILLKENPINLTNYYDIAIHNNFLFNKCNSAELEKTYKCLNNLNLLQKYNKYLNALFDNDILKAHNPLVDSYYTWIIFNVFLLNKINSF